MYLSYLLNSLYYISKELTFFLQNNSYLSVSNDIIFIFFLFFFYCKKNNFFLFLHSIFSNFYFRLNMTIIRNSKTLHRRNHLYVFLQILKPLFFHCLLKMVTSNFSFLLVFNIPNQGQPEYQTFLFLTQLFLSSEFLFQTKS